MTLRVTQGMMHLQLMRNLNRNMAQMEQLQMQTTTGRKINKASDDPVGITYSLRYRAELAANDQYKKNVDSALSWLEFNDTVLDQAGDVLKRLKELTTQGSNGTNPGVALDNIKNEILQLKTQLVEIGNSKMNGKAVFNGEQFGAPLFNTGDPAFDAKSAEGDKGVINYAISVNMNIDINFTADQVFGSPDPAGTGNNVFSVIDRIVAGLTSNNYQAVSAELGNIDSSVDRILNVRAEIGARVNRLELMDNRLADLGINLKDMKSRTEDADFEKLLIDSQINENIYQASLSVGAKVISKSLVDFLR
jgi:flagellar hook-associated protein 3 FlgL